MFYVKNTNEALAVFQKKEELVPAVQPLYHYQGYKFISRLYADNNSMDQDSTHECMLYYDGRASNGQVVLLHGTVTV